MKNDILITFGIPMYNSEKYIKELLDCFELNSSLSYEILIVNDGSIDKSKDICVYHSNKRIKIIDEENQGVSAARNNIILNASGKYLTFIDSDDLINFDKYKEMVNIMDQNNYDLLINIPYKTIHKSINYLIEKEIFNSPCMKLYKTEVLKDNKVFFDKKYDLGEDLIFNFYYYKHINNIGFYYGNIYNYRKINSSSLTIKYRKNKFETLMSVNKKCRLLTNTKKIEKALEFIRVKNCISCIITERKNKSLSIEYIEKIKKYKKREFIILNNLKTTIIYNLWYIIPNKILYLIFR